MAKKRIPKYLLDEAINADREYWSLRSDPGCLERSVSLHRRIEDVSGIDWISFHQLLSAILSFRGLKPSATNEDIYAVLSALGWEVS